MSLEGKVVVITGAGTGIGRAIALHLASLGAIPVLGGRRSDQLAAVVADIEGQGGAAGWCATDVTRQADLTALAAHACDRFGRLDVLVNNAGISPTSRFDALKVADWDAMIDVNLRGVLYGIAAVLPVFARQESGHIVNIVSTAGLRLVPTMGVYAATKNAVRTLTEVLRQEAGPSLRVTEISPGFVATDLASSITDDTVRSATQQQMDRMGLSPHAIAKAVAFAISQPAEVDVGSIVVRPAAQD